MDQAVAAPGLVLITGINGYIGAHTASLFLDKGWTVRGTVRSDEKAAKVKNLPVFKDALKNGKLEVVVAGDLAAGDVKEHLKGVTAICHIAAPMPGGTEYRGYVNSAVQPTVSLLQAAKDIETLEEFVLMSSLSAVYSQNAWNDPREKGAVYDESMWYEFDEAELAKLPASDMTTLGKWYAASKVLLEKEALNFVQKEKPRWKLATILPCMAYGPPIHATSIPDLIASGGTAAHIGLLTRGKKETLIPTFATNTQDVRDVAESFYQAVTRKATGRFSLFAAVYDFQILANSMRKVRPDLDKHIVLGQPDVIPSSVGTYRCDNNRAVKELGIKCTKADPATVRTIDETMKDSLDYMDANGFF